MKFAEKSQISLHISISPKCALQSGVRTFFLRFFFWRIMSSAQRKSKNFSVAMAPGPYQKLHQLAEQMGINRNSLISLLVESAVVVEQQRIITEQALDIRLQR